MSNKKSVITRYSKGNKYLYLLPSVLLGVYQLFSYNLLCTITDSIHFPYPQHLISRFELFSHAFLFGELFYKSIKHFECFFVNVGKVSGEFAACQKISIKDWAVILEISQMSLATNTDFNLWLFGQLQIGQKIISLLCVSNLCSHNLDLLDLDFLDFGFCDLDKQLVNYVGILALRYEVIPQINQAVDNRAPFIGR